MQRYTAKFYQRTSKKSKSPHLHANQQDLDEEDAFSIKPNAKEEPLHSSRSLAIAKVKCQNCQRLQKALTTLNKQLLQIERTLLDKEAALNKILAEKSQTIEFLKTKLQNTSEKNYANHCSSSFYTEPQSKISLLPAYAPRDNLQDSKHFLSLMGGKKAGRHSLVSVYNLDLPPFKNRQRAQARQLNQNISQKGQREKLIKDKVLTKLQFQNETLKNYNATLLVQLEKLKRGKY